MFIEVTNYHTKKKLLVNLDRVQYITKTTAGGSFEQVVSIYLWDNENHLSISETMDELKSKMQWCGKLEPNR
jgi:hypothetical protein